MTKFYRVLSAACCIVSSYLGAFDLNYTFQKEIMLQQLDFLQTTFLTSYAPRELKEQMFAFDLQGEIDLAKEGVNELQSPYVKNFQKITLDFFNSCKDYHVSVTFFSTESAELPFSIAVVDNKCIVTYVDPSLSKARIAIKSGDELVKFDGRPAIDVVKELRELYLGYNSDLTDMALAADMLTNRKGKSGMVVPSGDVGIVVLPKGTSKTKSYTLKWDHEPEAVSEPLLAQTYKSLKASTESKFAKCPYFNKKYLYPKYTKQKRSHYNDPFSLGAPESFVPQLGKVVWNAGLSSYFDAYIFESANGKWRGGYIRIPTYDTEFAELDAEDFGQLIAKFQKETDVLVIDQINNPGGILLYCMGLLSMLTDAPLEMPQQKMLISQSDVYYAADSIDFLKSIRSIKDAHQEFGDSLLGLYVDKSLIKSLLNDAEFIIDQWTQGHIFTDYSSPYGISTLNPHPYYQFTKPILVLVNELDFSGGDYFPAVLQDNKRATIMGTRTAGAGGYVLPLNFSNLTGIQEIHYTGSILKRKNGAPIENLGIEPDIHYSLTAQDYQNNFLLYKDAILNNLEILIKK